MSGRDANEISAFYDEHPYPPPVANLANAPGPDEPMRLVEHHRTWPSVRFWKDHRILIAGCGTSQAARWALRYPDASVVGIDVSSLALQEHERLRAQHGIDNLELKRLPVERSGELDVSFNLVVCTGVLHHLADPGAGLVALRDVLEPTGAIRLMVYATYGRIGVAMLREYAKRIGVDPTPGEISDLIASLRELSLDHPLRNLTQTRDFGDDDALADALLNPRERSYTVPELLELVDASELRFGRWVRQAPYLPHCGLFTEIPHGPMLRELDEPDQYAAVELYRGSITKHSAILHRDASLAFRWDDEKAGHYVPIRSTAAIAVEERLPDGAAAALLNTAHHHSDIVLFVDEREREIFDAIDGERAIGELGAEPDFVRRLWWHDLVVIDASAR